VTLFCSDPPQFTEEPPFLSANSFTKTCFPST